MNSKEGPDWRLWDQPESYPSKGLLALRAGESAKRQGQDQFDRFHLALLRARHEQGQDLTERATILLAAREAGLDLPSFERDLADRQLLKNIGKDHMEGVKRFEVFGTPTLIFDNGLGAYLRLKPPPPPEQALQVFEEFYDIVAKRPYVLEVKRPG